MIDIKDRRQLISAFGFDWHAQKMLEEACDELDRLYAMEAARAEPEPEPVAWMHSDPDRVDVIHESVRKLLHDSATAAGYLSRPIDKSERYTIPLYAAPLQPQAHREPAIDADGPDRAGEN